MIIELSVAAVALAVAPVAMADVTIPDGTLTIPWNNGTWPAFRYAYSISATPINAQNVPEVHVTGTVTGYSLPAVNNGWFTIGLITQSEWARSNPINDANGFNNSVFMMGMNAGGSSGNQVMPADYDGTALGGAGVGQAQGIGNSFTFDLKLAPNIGGTGGTSYLSVNGGAYGTGLAYGTDNWTALGGSYPAEDLSQAYLIAQIFEFSGSPTPTSSVSFENVTVTAVPEPATLSLVALAIGGLVLIRKRK
jgi:hypothetical protein